MVETGSYALKVRLKRLIPNVVPLQGLNVKCSYQGVKKQCSNCYKYRKYVMHETKKHYSCTMKTFKEYIQNFKDNNPKIPLTMMGLPSEYNNTGDEYNSSSKEGYDNENESGTDMEDTYFNYNYSYDFVPDYPEKQSV